MPSYSKPFSITTKSRLIGVTFLSILCFLLIANINFSPALAIPQDAPKNCSSTTPLFNPIQGASTATPFNCVTSTSKNYTITPSLNALAQAAPFAVNVLSTPNVIVTNTGDDSSTSRCPDAGFCTLREALKIAKNGDVIGFDPVIFAGSVTITLTQKELYITNSVQIIGTGAHRLFIDGNGQDRIFFVNTTLVTVYISNLTVQNGTDLTGGHRGGGIYNRGTLYLSDVEITQNNANSGGGIWNGGTLSIQRSSIYANNFMPALSGMVEGGGAIETNYSGTMTIVNSTIYGNGRNDIPDGGISVGYSNADAKNIIINTTIANNQGTSSGGISFTISSVAVKNSIITNNLPSNCANQRLSSYTFNHVLTFPVIDTTCPSDIQADPDLDSSIVDNGGNTRTVALLSNSAAINAGDNSICLGTDVGSIDQRGFARPVGVNCDLGAYEYGASLATSTPTATASITASPSNVPTNTSTPVPSNTPLPTITSTVAIPTATFTQPATSTPLPTATKTLAIYTPTLFPTVMPSKTLTPSPTPGVCQPSIQGTPLFNPSVKSTSNSLDVIIPFCQGNPTSTSTPTLRPTATNTSMPTSIPGSCNVKIQNAPASGVGLHDSPTSYSNRLADLSNGKIGTAIYRIDISNGDIWYEVQYVGQPLGWVPALSDGGIQYLDNRNCNLPTPYPSTWAQMADLQALPNCDLATEFNTEPPALVLARVVFGEAATFNSIQGRSGGVVVSDAINIAWIVRLDAFLGLPNYKDKSIAGKSVSFVEQVLRPGQFTDITALQAILKQVNCDPSLIPDNKSSESIGRMVYPRNENTYVDLYLLWVIYSQINNNVINAPWSTMPSLLQNFDQYKGVNVPVSCSTTAGGDGLLRPGPNFPWSSNQPYPPKKVLGIVDPKYGFNQLSMTCFQDVYHLDNLFLVSLANNTQDLAQQPANSSSNIFPPAITHVPWRPTPIFCVEVLVNPTTTQDTYPLAQLTGKNGTPWPLGTCTPRP